MTKTPGFNSILSALTVLLLVTWSPLFAQAEYKPGRAKTYAVFVASYNPKTGQARGGVAGTAFFVSPLKAVTAWHVLQPKSFKSPAGFTHTQVWLVYENEPAIELRPQDLQGRRDLDTTYINLDPSRAVSREFIFEVANGAPAKGRVETQGFRANSVGPILAADGNRLKITEVPALARLRVQGEILQKSRVQLRASDVNLNSAPCLQLSYTPVVGLSGGPVILNGQVIGMNSFADPAARAKTWALDLPTLL